MRSQTPRGAPSMGSIIRRSKKAPTTVICAVCPAVIVRAVGQQVQYSQSALQGASLLLGYCVRQVVDARGCSSRWAAPLCTPPNVTKSNAMSIEPRVCLNTCMCAVETGSPAAHGSMDSVPYYRVKAEKRYSSTVTSISE